MTKVTIMGGDQDAITVSGNGTGFQVNGAHRTNLKFYNNAAHSDGDELKFKRYFSKSGTYRAKWVYDKGTSLGFTDIGLDVDGASDIFSQVDQYAGSFNQNNESFSTVEISRGFHDIHFSVNGKNASSSNYIFSSELFEFTLINEHPVLGAEGVRKSSGVSWEEIGRKKIHQSEASINVKIPEKKFLMVKVFGIKTANLLLYIRFNGDATGTDTSSGNYSQRLNVNGGTDDVTGEQNRTQILLSSGSDAQTFSEFEIVNILDEEKLVIIHTLMRGASAGAGTSPDRMEYVGKWDVVTSLINEINLVASTSTFASGSEVVIYGHD